MAQPSLMQEKFVPYLSRELRRQHRSGEKRTEGSVRIKKLFKLKEEGLRVLNGIQQGSWANCPSYREEDTQILKLNCILMGILILFSPTQSSKFIKFHL